jgi:hypothetical protein
MSNDQWTKAKFEKLKKAYKIAVKEKKESFMFEGEEMDTLFIKYQIEFLQPRFNFK